MVKEEKQQASSKKEEIEGINLMKCGNIDK
jgi:hypothetical protein